MGNEIFYCTECGARASGSDFAPGTSGFGAQRSLCPACLGLPIVSRRESTKKIRKPSSPTIAAVAVRPRAAEAPPPRRSLAPLIGAAFLIAAAAVGFLMRSPEPPLPEPVVNPPTPAVAVVPAAPLPPPVPEAPPRCGFAQRPAKPESPNPEREAQGEAAYVEIEEAATALADEGRIPDALAQIRRFPETCRGTRAWANLERLRLRIEQRIR